MIIPPRKPHADRYPERILLHKKYDAETLEFDIALIKIDPVKKSFHIKPISLPDPIVCRQKRKKTRRGKGGKRKQKKRRSNGKRQSRQKQHKGIKGRKSRSLRISKRHMRKRSEYDSEDNEDGSGNYGSRDGSGSGEGQHCNIEEEQRERISWYYQLKMSSFIQCSILWPFTSFTQPPRLEEACFFSSNVTHTACQSIPSDLSITSVNS